MPTPSAPRSRPTKRQRVGEGKGDGDDSGDDNDDVHPSRKIPTNKKAESVSKPTSSTRLPGKARASPLDKDEKKTKTKTNRVFKPKPKPPTTTATTAPSLPDINQPPTEVLAVLVFGNGDAGELGLGPKLQDAARPRLNTYLDPDDPSAMHIVQLDCGGMHTIALTDDNRIVTWGVNDNGALGRNTDWEGGLRELRSDEGSEEEEDEGELNPQESIPTPISVDVFPPGTEFVQVAASDSCSLALTSTGLVYGWGTFKVSFAYFHLTASLEVPFVTDMYIDRIPRARKCLVTTPTGRSSQSKPHQRSFDSLGGSPKSPVVQITPWRSTQKE